MPASLGLRARLFSVFLPLQYNLMTHDPVAGGTFACGGKLQWTWAMGLQGRRWIKADITRIRTQVEEDVLARKCRPKQRAVCCGFRVRKNLSKLYTLNANLYISTFLGFTMLASGFGAHARTIPASSLGCDREPCALADHVYQHLKAVNHSPPKP